MACVRSPPSSPRASKTQPKKWNERSTTSSELFDVNKPNPTSIRSPNSRVSLINSSKLARSIESKVNTSLQSLRKFAYASSSSVPTASTDLFASTDESPRSPKIVYSAPPESKDSIHSFKSPTDDHLSCTRSFSNDSDYSGPELGPKRSNQFVFDAITPLHEPSDTISLDNKRHNASSTSKWINQSDNWRSGEALSSVGFPQRDDEPTSHVQSPNLCSGANKTTGQMRREPNSINITSNPAYQVLRTSHSTLDRTCSDSVVSLRYRKSTSDLTADNGNAPSTSSPKHRRRASFKGGLAYLASRRNSRESVKSNASNASLFSNEDLGPLVFQSSNRGRQRRTSNFLELPVPDHVRPRVCSLPERPYNPRQSDDLYRLRTFSISKGIVVNCGDSIISRRSRSNTSVNSTTSRASERSPFEGSCCGGGYATLDSLPPSPTDSDEPLPPPRYRVVLMGDAGTGKTALVSQFMTSEYMHTYDASLDDEFGEKTVSILLDGEESEMIFIDHPSSEMSVENSLSTYEPHGCVVVYSVVQRSSFRQAEEIVKYLWRENVTKDKAVILVGNKADLARSRVITTAEGKALAKSIEAKFIETSSGIQHNVDELLVGILKQIRLKETRDRKAAAQNTLKMRSSRTHISLHMAKEILQKICLSDITKSKSCENLHVL